MIIYSSPMKNMVGQDSSTIIVRREGEEIPAIFLNKTGTNSPFDKASVSANLKDLLNGLEPSHKSLFAGKVLQYVSLPGAIALNFQDENGGVTKEGLTITINQAAPADVIADLEDKIDADFVGRLCAATLVRHTPSPTPTTQHTLGR